MTDKQLNTMSTGDMLSAFLNKAHNWGSVHTCNKILLKLKPKLSQDEYDKLYYEFLESKSLCGSREELTILVKKYKQKYK